MNSSRRRFLQNAGIAATISAVQPCSVFAQGSKQSAEKDLAEPIARLKSRKADAMPITVEERRQRLEGARQL
ncbi:MAG: hypothetical protein ACRD4I_06100, partial [Candidatus Angelobacter sp.]